MKNKLLLATALFALSINNASADTMKDALSKAYETNPSLLAQRAYLRSVDENVAIQKSGYRPNINAYGKYSSVDGDRELDNGATESIDQDVTEYGISAKQNIFSGFSTINSVNSARNQVRAGQSNLYGFEQNVLFDSAKAYLDVLRDRAIVELKRNNEKVLARHLEATKQRFNVGEVTKTDLSQSEARLAEAKSGRISAEGNLEVSNSNYVRIIGYFPKDLHEVDFIDNMTPQSFNDAIKVAKNSSYEIKEAQYLLKSKKYDVYREEGSLLPSVDLVATASKFEYDNSDISNVDNSDNVTIGAQINIPLYSSGQSRAKIRQAKYRKWQQVEELKDTQRVVLSNVKSAWELKEANKSKLKAIDVQISANKLALEGVIREQQLGNRTVLDVLDAEQELLNAQVNEVSAKRDYYLSGLQLLSSMGKLTAKDLNLNVKYYNADKYFKKTRDKWLSTSLEK